MQAIARDVLPESGFGTRWTGEAAKFLESGNALTFGDALALLVVFLVLAGQFESFVHPLTILVEVALSFTGAILALRVTGTTLNIFSKIGLVMLVPVFFLLRSIARRHAAPEAAGAGLSLKTAWAPAAAILGVVGYTVYDLFQGV